MSEENQTEISLALRTAVLQAMFHCPIDLDSPTYRWLTEASMLLTGFDPLIARQEAHAP